MAHEPIVVYSRRIDPEGVVRLLRRIAKRVRVVGPDDDWNEAIVTVRTGFWRTTKIVVSQSSELYDAATWPAHTFGLSNYIAEFPEVEGKTAILQALRQLRFAVSFAQSDVPLDGDDPRCEVVLNVCRHLDGMIFTPSALRDASGRILTSVSGESHPQAELPRIVAEQPAPPAETDDDFEPRPPSATRAAKRAMVLAAIVERGFLEHEPGKRKKSQLELDRAKILIRLRAGNRR